MKHAVITLRQSHIDKLAKGGAIIIRLKSEEVEIRFDSLAKLGRERTKDDVIADFVDDLLGGIRFSSK